jgi:hypothetical protein
MFGKVDGVCQTNGLKDTIDVVIAVIAFARNSKADIDFAMA